MHLGALGQEYGDQQTFLWSFLNIPVRYFLICNQTLIYYFGINF